MEHTKKSRFKIARRCLLFWTLFIGIGAVAGAACMLIDPTGKIMGMDAMLPYFQVLPFSEILFQNFIFSGISLLIVNGLSNFTAAVLIFRKKELGIVLGGVFGVTLMLWICIQFYIFPLNFMSTIFFIFGLAQAITGYAAWVFCKQEAFVFNIEDYPNVGTDHSKVVVYFSRMGYVRKQAYEAAEKTGAEVYEIKATELTEGTAGFWWSGRYGMHKWPMPIEEISINLMTYDHVTICSPIWVYDMCAPIREFCMQASGKIWEADYILVHHQPNSYEHVANEMDRLLGTERTGFTSVQCKKGVYRLLEGNKKMLFAK